MKSRLLGGLLYLYLGGNFVHAWMRPLRPGADAWIQSAAALVFVEFVVAILIGPMLLAAIKGRPAGLSRLLTPGAVLLIGAACTILYYLWQATPASIMFGIGYGATVALRAADVAQADNDGLLEQSARMIVWFLAVVLAMFGTLAASITGAAAGAGSGLAPWTVKACSLYFLCLAAGEALLPFFRRGVDPLIHADDGIQERKE